MLGRVLLGVLFLVAGSLHFIMTQTYVRIVPDYLPAHLALVYVSGFFEILGGAGLLGPEELLGLPVRKIAAWGLVALLIAVVPANLYMVTDHNKFTDMPLWAAWLRLPVQLPLIWWAWLYSRG